MSRSSGDPSQESGPVGSWLRRAATCPERAGIFVDFDGTLAPIVSDPAAALPRPEAAALLTRLSERWGRVVVVSGRPVVFLLSHLAGAGRTELYGLYGLERSSSLSGEIATLPEAEDWRRAVSDVASAAERDAPEGVYVEHKGLTVTIHCRNAPDQAAWARAAAGDARIRTGLAVHRGKMSLELRPPVEVDKGTVVRDLAAGLDAVLFVGDDMGDLPAFAEMRSLRSEGVATLSVASGGDETPAEVVEAADLVVDGPGGVVGLLAQLLL